MIDWDRVEELKSEVGEDDFAEVVEMFFEEVAEAIERLCGPAPKTIAEDFHFIKGSALNIGLTEVSELCRSTEATLRESPGASVDPQAIETAFRSSKAQFTSVAVPVK